MARGWESKGVEEQQQSREPAPADGRREQQQTAERARVREELELKRERILSERTSSPHRRAALQAALADLDAQLAALP